MTDIDWKARAEAAEAELARLRAPVGGEVGEMVKDLEAASEDLTRRVFSDRCGSPQCAISSNVASRAADLLQRLADQVKTVLDREAATTARYDAKLDAAEARLATAMEALEKLRPASKTAHDALSSIDAGTVEHPDSVRSD